jgi:hypothetical protein
VNDHNDGQLSIGCPCHVDEPTVLFSLDQDC